MFQLISLCELKNEKIIEIHSDCTCLYSYFRGIFIFEVENSVWKFFTIILLKCQPLGQKYLNGLFSTSWTYCTLRSCSRLRLVRLPIVKSGSAYKQFLFGKKMLVFWIWRKHCVQYMTTTYPCQSRPQCEWTCQCWQLHVHVHVMQLFKECITKIVFNCRRIITY